MGVRQPTNNELLALVGTELPGNRTTMPAAVADWYFTFLQQHWLASRAAAGSLRVERSDAADTSVEVFAGRASFSGTPLAYAGGTVDLSSYGDDTVYLWAYNNSGTLTIGAAADATGWPVTEHIKLAEVTIASGDIGYDAIVDRRSETLWQGRPAAATTSLLGAVNTQTLIADLTVLTDNSGGTSGAGTIAAIGVAVTDPADTPADADTLRDDLVASTIPSIETELANLRNAVATLAAYTNTLEAKINAMLAAQKTAGQMSPT